MVHCLRFILPEGYLKTSTSLMLITLLLDEGSAILFTMYLIAVGAAGLFLLLVVMATRAAIPRLVRIAFSLLLWGLYLIVLWEALGFLDLNSGLVVLPFLGFGLCCYTSYRAVVARRPPN